MSDVPELPTAMELFRKFQPKFRQITFEFTGFAMYGDECKIYLSPSNKHYTCPDSLLPYFDFVEAELPFTMVYNPENTKLGPLSQMYSAAQRAVSGEVFAGREFYADPVNPIKLHGDMLVQLSHNGDCIKGLHFGVVTANDWRFFIPDQTPEYRTIEAALEFQEVQAVSQHRRHSDKTEDVVAQNFYTALQAVGVSC